MNGELSIRQALDSGGSAKMTDAIVGRPVPLRSEGSAGLDPGSAALTDAEVVARVRSGETALFELLMRRHNERLFRTLRAILRCDVEAEDAMQECYLRAYRELHTFEGRSRLSTWLTRIGVNLALDRRRRQSRLVFLGSDALEVSLETSATPGPVTPEAAQVSRELTRLLVTAIDDLPLDYRAVYVLREVEGLGTRETAESLGILEATVKTRLYRARARLREVLAGCAGASAAEVFRFGGERCNRVVARVLARLPGCRSGESTSGGSSGVLPSS